MPANRQTAVYPCSNCFTERPVLEGGTVEACPDCGDCGFNIFTGQKSGSTKKGGKRRSKYNNTHVKYDGFTFDSIAECGRYKELMILVRAEQIGELLVHPKYLIIPEYVEPNGRKWSAKYYESDFQYVDFEDGSTTVEDVKGCWSPEFGLQALLFVIRYPRL